MGQFFETIPESLIAWVHAQKLFWVATAPLSSAGHVNVSPKGGQYFGVADRKTFWYMDLTGSGIETISHLHEPGNGRITILFNAFEGPPRIMRFWGRGSVLEYGSPQFNNFVELNQIKTIDGTRSIIVVDIHQVGTSCGFSVPYFDFKEFRTTLNDFFEKRVASEKAGNKKDGIERYWAYKNAYSMDLLPGMQRGLATAQVEDVSPIKKMVGPLAPKQQYKPAATGYQLHDLVLFAMFSFVLGVIMTLQKDKLPIVSSWKLRDL